MEVACYPVGDDRMMIFYNDITQHKQAERVLRDREERQAFLLNLSDALRAETGEQAIATASVTFLGEHMRLDRAYVARVDEAADRAVIGPEYLRPGLAPVAGVLTLTDFPEAFAEVKARTLVLKDATSDPSLSDIDKRSFAALDMGALVVASARNGTQDPTWALLVASVKPRQWTSGEIALVEEVAERTWAAVERAHTETALHETEERLRQFGEASQDVLWIRDIETMQWTYLSAAFEKIYGLSREQALTGNDYRNWLELIVPEDRDHAESYIERVRQGDSVIFEYRVRRPLDGEIVWLRNTDFPIRDDVGRIRHFGGIGHDVSELKRIEHALGAAQERQRILVEGVPQLVWRAVDYGRWTWASPQWIGHTGQSDADSHGWGWLDALHPADRDAARTAWEQAKETGAYDVEYRIRDAHGLYHWFQTRATPVRDDGGAIIEWIGTSTDVDNLRQLQERQKVLVAELQHRTRNLITVVSALSHQTMKNVGSLGEFDRRFGDRLSALSRVQGLLSHLTAGRRVTFDELLRSELTALGAPDEKLTLEGSPGVPLRSATVQTFALALHELATNALKYGALAVPQGHLTVRWKRTETGANGPRLHVDWRETGVTMPHVDDRPRGGGYGRELIERALPYQLDADTTYEMTADGVHCTIDVPTWATNTGTDEEVEHGVA